MFANGVLTDARRHAETNVEELAAAIGDGADVIALCTSGSLSLRQEYPELFDDVGDSCPGISGTCDWRAEKYETSMAIGEEMFDHMEHGTGYEIRHPLELLEDALFV